MSGGFQWLKCLKDFILKNVSGDNLKIDAVEGDLELNWTW